MRAFQEAKQILRQAKRRFSDSERRARHRAKSAVAAVTAHTPKGRHLLIASSGAQNTGDQAMLDAFLSALAAPTTVLAYPESTYTYSSGQNVSVHTIPELSAQNSAVFARAITEAGSAIQNAESVSLVGADIIDGGYSNATAATLWGLAEGAARQGIPTRVIGFSWKANVMPSVREAAIRATRAGVTPYVRDPESAERAIQDGLLGVVSVADSVFTLTPPTDLPKRDPKQALLNISGLIEKRVDLTTDYVEVLRWLSDNDYNTTLVPHVTSPWSSDVTASQRLYECLTPDLKQRVTIRDTLVGPSEVQKLAASASVVVTGRMHLSILAATVGTPAIVIATQGKVEGLVRLLGRIRWSIAPFPGASTKIIAALEEHKNDGEASYSNLQNRLPLIRELAWKNYEGLPTRSH